MNRDVLPERRRSGLRARLKAETAPSVRPSPVNGPDVDGLTARLDRAEEAWAAEHRERVALQAELDAVTRERDDFETAADQAEAALAETQRQALYTPQELTELSAEVRRLREQVRQERDVATAERAARAAIQAQLEGAATAASTEHHERLQALEEHLHTERRTSASLETQLIEQTAATRAAQEALAEITAERDAALQRASKLAHDQQTLGSRAGAMMDEARRMVERLPQLEQQSALLQRQNALLTQQLAEAVRTQVPAGDSDPQLVLAVEGLRRELDDARSELALVCEARDEARLDAVKAEREAERARADREHLLSRVRAADAAAEDLAEARAALTAMEDAQADLQLAAEVERAEVEQLLRQATSRIDVLERQLAERPAPQGEVPVGSTVISEAELAAHENHVRQLDARRTEEARRRTEAEDRLRLVEESLEQAASVHRAARQRHAEVLQRYEQLTRTVLELQKLADVATTALALPPRAPGQLISLVPDAIRSLQSRLRELQAVVASKESELARMQELAPRRSASPERDSEVAASTPPVDSAGGARADRMLELLREAADQVRAG